MASGGFRSFFGRQVFGLSGASDFVPNRGGLRSLFGRQVFGLSGIANPPPPPPPPPPAVGGDDAPGAHDTYRKGERRRRGLEWDKRPDDLRERMERAYARARGEELPAAEVAAIAAVVRPHVETPSDAALPPVAAIDWAALLRDLQAVDRLLQLLAAQEEDDGWLHMMMLS